MEAFLFPSYLSPLGVRIRVFPSPTDKTKHVRREYEGIGMVITSYVPSLVEPRRVGATRKSTATVPQVVGTKERRINEERQYRQNRTGRMRIRRCRNDAYQLRSEFGRTAACRIRYFVIERIQNFLRAITTKDGYRIEKAKQYLQRWQKATNQTVTMFFTLLLLVV